MGSGHDVVLGDHGSVQVDGVDRDITTTDVGTGGDDQIEAGSGRDILLGGAANDRISGGTDDDLILGDYGTVYRDGSDVIEQVVSTDEGHGGNDTIEGQAGNDAILGGAFADTIFGGHADGSAISDADADLI